jgi:hypothetical protein
MTCLGCLGKWIFRRDCDEIVVSAWVGEDDVCVTWCVQGGGWVWREVGAFGWIQVEVVINSASTPSATPPVGHTGDPLSSLHVYRELYANLQSS